LNGIYIELNIIQMPGSSMYITMVQHYNTTCKYKLLKVLYM